MSFFVLGQEPDSIEYTPEDIRSSIRVEAQIPDLISADEAEAAKPERVTNVMALVGGGRSRSGDIEEPRAVAITAKPKRVKEIMRGAGYKLTEDSWRKEILGALRKTKE